MLANQYIIVHTTLCFSYKLKCDYCIYLKAYYCNLLLQFLFAHDTLLVQFTVLCALYVAYKPYMYV